MARESKKVHVARGKTKKVCPYCGHGDFQKKEGFSLFGQQFVCAKCKGAFKAANTVKISTTDVRVDKSKTGHKSSKGKPKKKR